MPVVVGAMENVRSGHGGKGESGDGGFFLLVHIERTDDGLQVRVKRPLRRGLELEKYVEKIWMMAANTNQRQCVYLEDSM